MSRKSGYGPVPDRWLHCPRKSLVLIQNKFCAFKTPLCSGFNSQVPEECRFSVKMLFDSMKSQRIKLGLWIDLTNTKRFYDRSEVEDSGCRYLKIPCKGRGETPNEVTTNAFVEICRKFIQTNPLEMIGIHCTHGFNRTGFLIVSYLVEELGMSVDAALAEFATARPPGIYKLDYIQELYKKYDDFQDCPPAPPRPSWCLENNPENDDEEIGEASQSSLEENDESYGKRRKREHFTKNPVFMDGVPGVTPLVNFQIASGIQRHIQNICGWTSGGFPGCQPVSMDVENISMLNRKPYRMSWKADGTRYFMLIQSDGQVYFADRNFSIFEVSGLRFPHARDPKRNLRDTLLDGEMVIDVDKSDGRKYPRYLAYDVIMYDGNNVSKEPFDLVRYNIIERDIIGGRIRAFKEGRMNKDREPFSVRRKTFYELNWTANILGEKFAKQLSHEPDGLIFQPAKDPYITGPCPDVLKWKPLSLNSVDFKLKITKEEGLGILPRSIGLLYVGGHSVEFARMKVNKQMKELNNKIIECKFENNEWVFMRERTDKSFPNSYNTAMSVCQSIINPVTKEKLLDFIQKYQFQDDADLMPPPNRIR